MKHVEQVFREEEILFGKPSFATAALLDFGGEFKSSTKRNFIMPEACQTRN